ncbi:MAG: hypothetical protein H7Z72_21900 [Bacteroidetes bacterium]|nr:hypothetical protein [Fibrella sp.]
MKSKSVVVLSLLLLLAVPAYTQSPGKPKPIKNSQTPSAGAAGSQPTKPTGSKPKPVTPTEPLAGPSDGTGGQVSEEQLRQLEAQNEAILRRDGAEATYYRMNRSSMTVLPVIIQVPGLGETDDKGKPVYARSELFRRRQVLPLAGDMLVSAKHHYNTVRFDMQSVFTKLLQDSANFYALTKLPPPRTGLFSTGTNKELRKNKSTSATQAVVKQGFKRGMGDYLSGKEFTTQEGPLETALRESLVRGNVGTSILKVWTNKPVLMERIMMTQKEADRVERVDVKKMAVWQNMLRKNYLVVLALINPHKDIDHNTKTLGKPLETYKSGVEAFLFHIDTVGLDINNIHNQHNLRFVNRLSTGMIDCDPRSEEFSEVGLGGGVSMEQMQEKVKQLVANDLRHQADVFYQAKSYECAKNYYTYVLSAKPADSVSIQKIIDKCSAQLGRASGSSADSTCLAGETTLFEEWVYGQGASNTIIQDFERHINDLKVASYVVKTEPMIAAEIGYKEGVYVDQRFLVYRKTEDKGVVGRQRVGTLRAVRVSANTSRFNQFKSAGKNPLSGIQMTGAIPDMFQSLKTYARSDSSRRTVTRAQPTKSPVSTRQSTADSIVKRDLATMTLFKQVDGGHIEPYDLIEQNDDYGVGLLVGYGLKLGVAAFTLGGDVRLGRVLPGFIPVAGIRLGFNASFLNKQRAQAEWKVEKDKTTALEIYLGRELYLSPRFDLKPLAGVSIFNDTYNPMFGTAALINISGRNSNTKVKLAPDVSYVLGYTYQTNVNLKFDF